jgi:hypothetical protein
VAQKQPTPSVKEGEKVEPIKTVDDLIRAKSLTCEELELHRMIIEECREREKRIDEYRQITEENMRRLAVALKAIAEKTQTLGKALEKLVDATDSLYLKSMPSYKFFRE